MSGRPGLLIALSGVDCAGKSTQRDLLVEALRSWGARPVTVYARPGYTPGLRAVKNALRSPRGKKERAPGGASAVSGRFPRRASNLGNPLVRWLWVTTSLLDLLWLCAVRMRLLKARGRTVVCNRYLLDALVDYRVNFPAERVEERWLCRALRRLAPRPDAAFCLMISADETAERASAKARFHRETPEVLLERWRAYLDLSEDLGVQIIDGALPVEEIARLVQQRAAGALSTNGSGPADANERAPAVAERLVNLREW